MTEPFDSEAHVAIWGDGGFLTETGNADGQAPPRQQRRKDVPADYAFGGDLFNCPNPQRLAVLYGEAMGWTDIKPQVHLTTGMDIGGSYMGTDGVRSRFTLGCFRLQDFAAGRTDIYPAPSKAQP